jgi:y4mF family transcriptional regulator
MQSEALFPSGNISGFVKLQSYDIFPYGNIALTLVREQLKYSRTVTSRRSMAKYATKDIGRLIHDTRRSLGVTQKELALTSGTGMRFIIELEKGKETAEIGKVLTILQTLGIQLAFTPPPPPKKG